MEQTELIKFASYFHQDFGVLHVSAEEGAECYLKTISADRKAQLLSEVSKFLSEHPGKNHRSKKNTWLKLGARWWSKEEIVPLLEGMAR